ncbi:hypothetical protein [Pedobacter endophyticus]|uniref:Uncharacterized protein n=1 Tax=Pedobacter endophyticus TaxID=2789740 RepID=A0A7S9PYP5_9SPHI|nr:hypothetical protein [Pedobacter endophyticus]QPH39678.1 hypothetical protein IZT61_22025 [Pedobacter endophyticus]
MKAIYLFFAFCLAVVNLEAQVRAFIAVVKTAEGKKKGVLHKVDSANVFLQSSDGLVAVAIPTIEKVQIRPLKKNFEGVDLIKIGSEEEYTINSRGERVDKWGKEAPSPEEELGVTFFSIIATAIANGLAAPIHAINPNLAKFKFDGDVLSNKIKLEKLSYYSIYYQANPNILAELKQIKEISNQFKP